ncbi:MAG: helix-turn-helix domain-containing protein [Planctomycetes bacterium]|nr:helix-turn-helix domain-containing protein [Planctomycetota bacterium]
MQHYHPEGLVAGFHAESPDPEVPELCAVGEQWTPAHRRMGWHTHDQWEFYLQIDGQTLRRDASASYEMHPKQLFIASPGVRHRVVNRQTGHQRNAFVRFRMEAVVARHPAIAPAWRRTGCIHLCDAESVEAPMRMLVREVTLSGAYRADALRAILDLLVLTVTRLLLPQAPSARAPMAQEVWKAKDLLDHHCERAWSLADLGRAVGLSPNHLGHLFTRHLGMSPHRYLMHQRVEQAKHLLASSDAAITGIALRTGFASSQHFAKTFRAIVGMPAKMYRERTRAPGRTSA